MEPQHIANTPPPRSPWWSRLLKAIFLAVFSLFLLLFVLATFFDKQVSQQLVAEINKNLKTQLRVGDANLSLISGFPAASVELSAVELDDAMGGQLLIANALVFKFNLLSLFSDDLKIHSVQLRNAAVRMVVNKAGKSNADIFKEEPAKAKKQPDESNLKLALEHAELKNVAVLYENRPGRQAAEFKVNNAELSGNFSAQKFQLSSRADLEIAFIDSDSSRYLAGEKVTYDAVLGVDLKRGVYAFQNVELTLGGNTFNVDGAAISRDDITDLDLKLVSQEGDISMVANLLPGAYHDYFKAFQSSGNYSCSGLVKGRLSKTETPEVQFEVSLRDGKVSSEMLQSSLRNVSFRARYHTRADGSGDFELADFRGDFGGHALSLDLKVNQINDPVIDFQANGVLPLEAAYGLFNDELITSGDGFIRLNRLSVQGRYADMTSMRRVSQVNAAGEIQFDRATVTYNKIPVRMESGYLRLQDNTFQLEGLSLQAGKSDFALDGTASNLLPVLFADSLNTANAMLEFQANLRSTNLDVDQLIEMFSVQTTVSEAGGESQLDSIKMEKNAERSLNMEKLNGVFEANIQAFDYGKIEGKHFLGKLQFDRGDLNILGNAQAMQGTLDLNGKARLDQDPTLEMRITATDLDLQTMLLQCENFGQDIITDANMRGRLNGRIMLWAYWNITGEFDMKRFRALADVRATNGELVKVKMFEDFATFVHIEDLRRVKFTDLQNYLEIKNEKVYIPVMLIQSNALNMTLSGEHSFNNDINYKIKINAGQVLLNRLKKHDNDLDPLPDKGGWFNLYYSITGNTDKYEMKRRKRTVKEEFERSEARKEQIAAQLNEYLGEE
ncbi:MAG TPA: hypothetical protein DCF33_03360 [Saprospirales bacterium]|nr:hypothetical protein [Saprospirales bacterium]